MTDDSRALSAQETNVGAPHGAIRARQGEDDAAAVMTTGGGVPAEWPVRGPDFNPWYRNAAGFVALVQNHPSAWLSYSGAKYLNVRIDTRSGDFVVTDRDGKEFNMDRWLKVAREGRFRGAYREPPTTPLQGNAESPSSSDLNATGGISRPPE